MAKREAWKKRCPSKVRSCRFADRARERLPQAESHRFEGAAVLLQRDLTLGATVEIIEDHFWYTPLRKTPKVFDIDYSRRSHFACRPGHSSISHRARRRFCASLWYRRK